VSSSIYLRLLFLDNQGEILVNVGVARNVPEPWINSDLLATKEIKTIIIQSKEHSHMVLTSPYHYKGKRVGTILAEINHDEVIRQLIQPRTNGYTTYAITTGDSEYILRYDHTDKRQSVSKEIPDHLHPI